MSLVLVACGDDGGSASDAAPEQVDAAPGEPDAATPAMTLVASLENGDVVVLDEATGAETVALEVSSAGADIGKVSSMEYGAAGDVWWLGTGGNAACRGCLYELDAASGEATRAGDGPDASRGLPGLCADPADGTLYTAEADGDGGLYTVDAETGVRTEVSTSVQVGSSGKGCAFTGPGRMLLAGGDALAWVDTTAGYEVTPIGALGYTGFTFVEDRQTIGSVAVRGDGTVFAIVKDGGGVGRLQATYLATIDPDTAEVTLVGATSAPVDGLAYVPAAKLP